VKLEVLPFRQIYHCCYSRRSTTCGYENQSFQDKDDVEQKCDSLVCAMSGVLNLSMIPDFYELCSLVELPPALGGQKQQKLIGFS
jgi:hypothetical protein